jgi:hypothetical protein
MKIETLKEQQRKKLTDILYELNLPDIKIDYKLVDLFNESWDMAERVGFVKCEEAIEQEEKKEAIERGYA